MPAQRTQLRLVHTDGIPKRTQHKHARTVHKAVLPAIAILTSIFSVLFLYMLAEHDAASGKVYLSVKSVLALLIYCALLALLAHYLYMTSKKNE